MIERLFTTGVYGKTEDRFFGQLMEAHIDTFYDIRMRRGVRGSEYAFVNSNYLQRALAQRGILYTHVKELAPSHEIRKAQHAIDAQQDVSKRNRQQLGDEFRRRYIEEVLAKFDSEKFSRSLPPGASRIVLFCVEGNPLACHRSLVADRLHADWGVPVEHL